jgi:DNA-binding HxlR family transcriptional regulator
LDNLLNATRVDTEYADSAARAVAALLNGKWRVEVLCAMRSGPIRLGQLSRLIPEASKKMLTHNLRRLEADGIVVRRDMSGLVLHVEYDFDRHSKTEICALIDHLVQWGRLYTVNREYISEREGSPGVKR